MPESVDPQATIEHEMELFDFASSDFGTDGLTPEEYKDFHAHLGVAFFNGTTLLVDSKTGTKSYKVAHNLAAPTLCECPAGRYNNCKSHVKRALLVLIRRRKRRHEEEEARVQAEQAKHEHLRASRETMKQAEVTDRGSSPLHRQGAFNLMR